MAIAAVTSSSPTVDQTSHRLVCDTLHGVLRQFAEARPGAGEEIGSMLCRVSAVVYTLLLDHPIDRRGRCRSCRGPGPLIGLRRRPCRIYLRASYWLLRQPDEAILRSHLGDDLGLRTMLAPGAETSTPAVPNRALVITGGMP